MDLIYQAIWTFIQNQIKNSLLDLCRQLLSLIASGSSSFWTQPLISTFLNFSKWVNFVVFGVAILFMLFDIAEEIASGKGVDYGVVFTNTVKAMVFVNFNTILAIMCMHLSDILTTSLNFKIPSNSADVIDRIGGAYTSVPFIIMLFLVVLIACLVFFVMSVMRYGAMFVHILSSSLYIPDILRGDTTSMGSWLRQMIAIAGTYVFQYITFYLGLYYLMQRNVIMCAICWAGMASVSKILQKFGYSTGTRGMFSTAGSLASQGISLLSKV